MQQELLCSIRWPTTTGVGAIKAFLQSVPSDFSDKGRSFVYDVFTFRAMGDNLSCRVCEVEVNGDFPTIVRALQNSGERSTGPFRGVAVPGRHAFGIEVNADIVQRFF